MLYPKFALISKEFVVQFVRQIKDYSEEIKPSFFELTVAMMLQYFKEQAVDIAIVETGLGGRLDSTNIISPELSVITNIGFDHMNMLGDTLELAWFKAQINNHPVTTHWDALARAAYRDDLDTQQRTLTVAVLKMKEPGGAQVGEMEAVEAKMQAWILQHQFLIERWKEID